MNRFEWNSDDITVKDESSKITALRKSLPSDDKAKAKKLQRLLKAGRITISDIAELLKGKLT
jgi:hypothetical protein